MFDNLRDQANSAPFYEDEAQFQSVEQSNSTPFQISSRFLGMSPIQRFIIAAILMIMVCAVGRNVPVSNWRIGLL